VLYVRNLYFFNVDENSFLLQSPFSISIKEGEKMKKLNILICIAFALSVVVLLFGVSNSTAEGINGKLTGTYAVSTVITCTSDNELTFTAHYQGLLTFYGDGFGVSEGMGLAINHNPAVTGTGLAGVRVVSGSFTYNVENNNYFTIAENWSVVGAPVTIGGIMQEGRIGHGAQTLLITDTDTNVEEISRDGSVVRTRTCGRSGTAVKIQSD
jgi:hypothetical protein